MEEGRADCGQWPTDVVRNLPLVHTSRAGTEYKFANGGVMVDIGEKQVNMITKFDNRTSMTMSFQVFRVHEPLLAVSCLVEAGRKVGFGTESHTLFLHQERRCRRTVEMEIMRSRSGCRIQVLLGRAEGRSVVASHQSTC